MKDIFTTYEIAKLCNADITTIKNWINAEKLKAYKTPGGHRRVKREDLMEFLQKYELPIPSQIKDDKLTILIVDDDRNIVNIITRAIKKQVWNIRIESAYDGYEAGIKVATTFPGLAILDNELPGIDGYKVMQDIKANKKLKGIKILAITGKDIPETKDKFLSGGADAFLGKPFQIEELIATVAKLLDLSR